jgi:hypothetical protein
LLKALEIWGQIAGDLGITKAELAYWWVAFHSLIDGNHGDGIIIGATKIQQVTRTVAGLNKGPLGVDVAARIDDLWKMVEHEAPVDNFSKHIRFKKDSKWESHRGEIRRCKNWILHRGGSLKGRYKKTTNECDFAYPTSEVNPTSVKNEHSNELCSLWPEQRAASRIYRIVEILYICLFPKRESLMGNKFSSPGCTLQIDVAQHANLEEKSKKLMSRKIEAAVVFSKHTVVKELPESPESSCPRVYLSMPDGRTTCNKVFESEEQDFYPLIWMEATA